MEANPIVTLELMVSVRRTNYYVTRIAYAVLLFVFVSVQYFFWWVNETANIQQGPPNFAREFFHTFAYLQITLTLAIGPAFAGGTIARERERRTLEYLLATPISAAQIVWAKFLASLLKIGVSILAGVPILAFTLLLGGVGFATIQWMFIVTFSTLLAVVGLSLGISVHTRRARTAVVATYIAVLLLLLLPVIVIAILAMALGTPPAWLLTAVEWYMNANPYAVLAHGLRQPAGPTWSDVMPMVLTHASIALLGVLEAIRSLRSASLLAEEGPRSNAALHPARRWKLGRWPMLWKEIAGDGSVLDSPGRIAWRVVLILLGGASAGYAVVCYLDDQVPLFISFVAVWGTLIASLTLLILTIRAAGTIAQEREKQSWDALMTTPLTGPEILVGKGLGCIYSLRWGWGLLLWHWVLATAVLPQFAIVLPLLLINLMSFIAFCTLVGIAFSLRFETGTTALGLSLLTVCVMGSGCACNCIFPSIPGTLAMPVMMAPYILDGATITFLMFSIPGLISYPLVSLFIWIIHSQSFDRFGRQYWTLADEAHRQRQLERNRLPTVKWERQ